MRNPETKGRVNSAPSRDYRNNSDGLLKRGALINTCQNESVERVKAAGGTGRQLHWASSFSLAQRAAARIKGRGVVSPSAGDEPLCRALNLWKTIFTWLRIITSTAHFLKHRTGSIKCAASASHCLSSVGARGGMSLDLTLPASSSRPCCYTYNNHNTIMGT